MKILAGIMTIFLSFFLSATISSANTCSQRQIDHCERISTERECFLYYECIHGYMDGEFYGCYQCSYMDKLTKGICKANQHVLCELPK